MKPKGTNVGYIKYKLSINVNNEDQEIKQADVYYYNKNKNNKYYFHLADVDTQLNYALVYSILFNKNIIEVTENTVQKKHMAKIEMNLAAKQI